MSNEKEQEVKAKAKKGLLSKIMDKLDKKLVQMDSIGEKKSKQQSCCCGNKNKNGGNSCC